jgi:hypothetical protein
MEIRFRLIEYRPMKYFRWIAILVFPAVIAIFLQWDRHVFYEWFSDERVLGKTASQIEKEFGKPVFDLRHADDNRPPEGEGKFHLIYFYGAENIEIEFTDGKATHVDHGWK